MDLRQVPVSRIKGVGDKTAKLLNKLHVESVHDLLWHVPRSYLKYPEITPISGITEGQYAAVKGVVDPNFKEKNTGKMLITTFTVHDSNGPSSVKLQMVFFRQTYLRNYFKAGSVFVFCGTVKRWGNMYSMEMPEYCSMQQYSLRLKTLQPVYPLTKGLSSRNIQKYIGSVIDEFYPLEDNFSVDFAREHKLLSLSDAFRSIHFPKDREDFLNARNTLVFHEFYEFLKEIEESKTLNTDAPSEFVIKDFALSEKYEKMLPFPLTTSQKSVLSEIKEDFSSGKCMRRLIQGDVGSGKTLVAFLAMADAANAGYQCAMMAPTEVLATQHYEKFLRENEEYCLGLKPCLLTGSLTAAKKRKLYEQIKAGEFNIIIGTHAIFQEKVEFSGLALVITDEQHRFGVKQRETLSAKGNLPHVLVMSATPIPRTLTLTIYADLKVSVMKDMPSKRLPIKSCVIDEKMRPNAYTLISEQMEKGHQSYVICPMVEENEDLELENVCSYHKRIDEFFKGRIRYGILHGRMKPAEKNSVMEAFAKQELDLLISTTVIEVGIDVPNATVILIENAERFGLAQLHQLRGRVGRGDAQSYCIFLNGSGKPGENERLEVLHKSNDGFFIAEEDLRLRGPGDINGIRQSGDMQFILADIIQDYDILVTVKEVMESGIS